MGVAKLGNEGVELIGLVRASGEFAHFHEAMNGESIVLSAGLDQLLFDQTLVDR